MEYTNEFLARVYGTYAPCKVMIRSIDQSPFDIDAVNYNVNKVMLSGDYSGGTNAVHQHDWWCISDYKKFPILLTPLSEISDEDAIEVAKMSFPLLDRAELLKAGRKIAENRRSSKHIDRLRQLGYDCGYGEIPSLIEAGIAIKKQ